MYDQLHWMLIFFLVRTFWPLLLIQTRQIVWLANKILNWELLSPYSFSHIFTVNYKMKKHMGLAKEQLQAMCGVICALIGVTKN